MSDDKWPLEKIDLLRSLWARGDSGSEIGRIMGISKNAVVGKAHRLLLPPRPSPIKAGQRQYSARRHAAFMVRRAAAGVVFSSGIRRQNKLGRHGCPKAGRSGFLCAGHFLPKLTGAGGALNEPVASAGLFGWGRGEAGKGGGAAQAAGVSGAGLSVSVMAAWGARGAGRYALL
jgi:hypothetical protein